ncbi:hypothetical protein, partial [Lactobacillus taiwanensis]|uniref:hypothetical protein n=1 Tax=Lactobacillus taiwanensis TaxID=508451 RepID=UPI00272C2AF8
MTEKRADYRKKQQKEKLKKVFDSFKRQKKIDPAINTAEQKIETQDSQKFESRENFSLKEERESKINRLKKRLNYAILIVVVLLIIVL